MGKISILWKFLVKNRCRPVKLIYQMLFYGLNNFLDIFNELELWLACKTKMIEWSKIVSIISQEKAFAGKFTPNIGSKWR